MTNTERIQTNNAELRECISIVESLPDVGGGDESVWVEDNSKVVFEKSCYQNSTTHAYITENGTLTYKKTKASSITEPKWAFADFGQVSSYGHGVDNKYWYEVEQAEMVNDEQSSSVPFTTIGKSAFACLVHLKRVRLPDTITSIGTSAFICCSSLKHLELPNTVNLLGSQAFRESGLETFDIPTGVTQLSDYTFSNCRYLKNINGLERITSIGNYCFEACMSLTGTLVLGEATNTLGKGCFRYNPFDAVKFLGTPTSIDGTVFDYTSTITDIYVPWAEGEVANAPWGATNATIHYNTVYDKNHEPIV